VDQRENTAASGKHNLTDEDFTRAVLASFGNSKAERFRQVVQSLVRHLHAFISEVKLTEEEWFKGIDFLTRTGHITDDERQEFILLFHAATPRRKFIWLACRARIRHYLRPRDKLRSQKALLITTLTLSFHTPWVIPGPPRGSMLRP
jgi:hypothetical protein